MTMKRTKLEEYVSLIQILQKRGPLEKAQILHLENIESKQLAEELDFLLNNRIVKTQDSGGSQVYFSTPTCEKIIKYFGLPTVKLKA